MSGLVLDNKSVLISGRGKLDRIPVSLDPSCRRVALINDPDAPSETVDFIASLIRKKGIDCVFYSDLNSKSTSKDAEKLLQFIEKGYIQCVVSIATPEVLDLVRIALESYVADESIDNLMDASEEKHEKRKEKKQSVIDLFEVPISLSTPLIFTQYASVVDSRNRRARLVDTSIEGNLIFKDPVLYDKLSDPALYASCFGILLSMLEVFFSKENNYFTKTLTSAPFKKLMESLSSDDKLSSGYYSDLAICADVAYSIEGPGIIYFMALCIKSLTSVPLAYAQTVLLPYAGEYYSTQFPDIFKKFAKTLGKNDEYDSEEFAAELRRLIKTKNLPMRLSELGIRKESLEMLLSYITEYPNTINNSCALDYERIAEIIKNAY